MHAKLRSFYQHKVVLVAGGSSGIGFCIAQLLAQSLAKVVILARDAAKLQQARQRILSQYPQAHIHSQTLDVADFESCQKTLADLISQYQKIDILINCAGRALPDYFINISPAQFAQTLHINTLGAIHLAKAIVPHFIENRAGQILNTASVAGFLGVFGYTDYCASKFAIVGFSEALQQELARYHIHVGVLFPPDTNTQGFLEEAAHKPPETIAISSANKIIEPEYVAQYTLLKLAKRRQKIIPSLPAKISFYAKRFCPWLVDKIMYAAIIKSQK